MSATFSTSIRHSLLATLIPAGTLGLVLHAAPASARSEALQSAALTIAEDTAVRWSACFEGAMGLAARAMKVALPADTAIDAEVDLGMTGDAYLLQARLNVSLPGVDRETAQAIIERAHLTCPYSKATRGNIDVVIKLAEVEARAPQYVPV